MPRQARSEKQKVTEGALPAERLAQPFPPIKLPIQPPYPPMEAKPVAAIPSGEEWFYEPKWDGFRCLAFRHNHEVLLQSKAGQPLGRYFPELVDALAALPIKNFVLDGEIVIMTDGRLSFDDLLMRIHPAASRIRKLSQATPATLLVFDLLVDGKGKALLELPLAQRRERLQLFFGDIGYQRRLRLSPVTRQGAQAQRWMEELAGQGFDGVVAKRADLPYQSGLRTGMQKIKRLRTADCVVGGYRYSSKGGTVGSLLLGLYNDAGQLDHVGFTSSFTAAQREALKQILEPLRGDEGFTGRAPGGPSRWSTERSGEWQPLQSKLVCEVQYDHFSQGRFRHGTQFLRWRPEKKPRDCTFEQVTGGQPGALRQLGIVA